MRAIDRRRFLLGAAALSAMPCWARPGFAASRFDLQALKGGWKRRLEDVSAKGKIPLIDVESSFPAWKFDLDAFKTAMDEGGLALSCLSTMVQGKEARKGEVWDDGAQDLMRAAPERFIPTTVSAIYPVFTQAPGKFLDETFRHAEQDGYALLGEFEFRHYPSPPEYKRGEMFRDVFIPLNGEFGHRLFAFSAKTGLAFQIHYEIEDQYLLALEEMLAAYPKAKVIWCHLAQVRYASRAPGYGPAYVRKLIETYPNLWFDTAFGTYDSHYPGSQERHARVWESQGVVKKDWRDVIEHYPWRFLAGLDLGGDRMDEVVKKLADYRSFLSNFSPATQAVVGYRAAWKLLFSEEIA